MFSSIKRLFAPGTKVDLGQLIAQKAVIIDVRTRGEFQGGHVAGSMNIPLQSLGSQLPEVGKDMAIITCCASGIRSSAAASLLTSKGFTNVHNGGSWQDVNQHIKR